MLTSISRLDGRPKSRNVMQTSIQQHMLDLHGCGAANARITPTWTGPGATQAVRGRLLRQRGSTIWCRWPGTC